MGLCVRTIYLYARAMDDIFCTADWHAGMINGRSPWWLPARPVTALGDEGKEAERGRGVLAGEARVHCVGSQEGL